MKRNGKIDFWKFVFAFIIVLFHGKNLADVGTTYIFSGGSIGVEFFFLVSGAMMTASSERRPLTTSIGKDTIDFMKHKILGLCPNVYVAWIIAFVVGHLKNHSVIKILQDGVGSIFELLFVNQSGLMGYRANAASWYLSAMLLAMFIIYPLMRKYKDSFYYIIAPITFVFLMGITYQNFKSLRLPSYWNGFIFKGMLRAIMEILGGIICYKMSQHLKEKPITMFGKFILTIIEWVMYLTIIIVSYGNGGSKYDWVFVIFFMIGITITLSEQTVDMEFFRNKMFYWVGSFSFSLYLAHGFWSRMLKSLLPETWTYVQLMCVYLMLAIMTGVIVMYSSLVIKCWWRKNGHKIKKLFLFELPVYFK